MDINSCLYYQSACELGLPTVLIEEVDGFNVILGKRNYYFAGGITPFNSEIAARHIANNKYCMNWMLRSAGLPLPKATAIGGEEFKEGKLDLADLKFPLVAKPTKHSYGGKDVLCNIQDLKTLEKHLQRCFKQHAFMSIEEFKGGLQSYRVVVFFGKVIGIVKRIPSHVVGDGEHTIAELMVMENEKRRLLKAKVSVGDLKEDEECRICLKEQGLTINHVPSKGKEIALCYACNALRGGTMIAMKKEIAKENADLVKKAAKVLSLNLVGFDILCENIEKPIEPSKGWIIEANSSPDVSIHENPLQGIPSQVSKMVLRRLIRRHPFYYVWNKIQSSRFFIKHFFVRMSYGSLILMGLLKLATKIHF